MSKPTNVLVSSNGHKTATKSKPTSKKPQTELVQDPGATDPNLVSISITQGADPHNYFMYTIGAVFGDFNDNPSQLTGADLSVVIEFNDGSPGYIHDNNETPLPSSYTIYGRRIEVITAQKASLQASMWPSVVKLTEDTYNITARLFIKNVQTKVQEFLDVEVTEDLDVLY